MILLTLYGWHLAAVIGFAVAFGGLGVWWAHADIRRALDDEERRQQHTLDVLTDWPVRRDLGRMSDAWTPEDER